MSRRSVPIAIEPSGKRKQILCSHIEGSAIENNPPWQGLTSINFSDEQLAYRCDTKNVAADIR